MAGEIRGREKVRHKAKARKLTGRYLHRCKKNSKGKGGPFSRGGGKPIGWKSTKWSSFHSEKGAASRGRKGAEGVAWLRMSILRRDVRGLWREKA